jgi:transitional endoplasmic reticulum ATPase
MAATGTDNAVKIRDRALLNLANLGGRTTSEDDIKFEGKLLIIPETFKNLDEVIKWLREKRDEEEMDFRFQHAFKYRPMDGAVATGNAIKAAFGATVGKPIVTIFGKRPPELIDVEVGVGETVQAPWGMMEIPGLPGLSIYLGSDRDPELGIVFSLMAEGPRKYRFHVQGLFKLIEHELATNSIYRGKAIDGQPTPRFIDLRGVDPEDVVYSEEVQFQLSANVWSPMVHADELARLKEPGKRAILFSGPYGTGKTLAAFLTAQIAVTVDPNPWTFIMVRPGRDDLMAVLQTARMYQPACVFCEDLDTVAQDGRENMGRLLDVFDGLDTKGLRMLLVLTTNSAESLHPAMLRPGRLDAIIEVGALDKKGIEKLAKRVLGEDMADDVDWKVVHEAFRDYLPAFIREVLARTKRYAVAKHGRVMPVGTEELIQAAHGLRPQWELQQAALAPPPEADSLTLAIENAVRRVTRQTTDKTYLVEDERGQEKLEVKSG